ncbi:Pentatricopeptide repeat [Dillenia turbinata]|uniref:Pentatricopeptide repeat n=1 Tax=Dillenia turbinata TaxID=194707 RepID=A0AAN8UVF6_9MAGN
MKSEMVTPGPDHVTFKGLLRASIEAVALLNNEMGHVFKSIAPRDLVMWNVIASCYAINGLAEEAAKIFSLMHSEVIRPAYDLDLLVASALVDAYAKSDCIDDARRTFEGMTPRNVVSWTTMIVGYGRHGDEKEAMNLLKEMLREDFCPDELTLASTLSSCANISSCCEVTQVPSHAMEKGLQAFCSIVNALINAYSKRGSIASTFVCFNLAADHDLITWTSMIGAYASHGLSREAIGMFEKMLSNSVRRDSAHYTCLIDLLRRAGLLNEALNSITSMPSEPTSNALGAIVVVGCGLLGKLAQLVSSDNATHEALEVYAMLETLVGSMKDEDCPEIVSILAVLVMNSLY